MNKQEAIEKIKNIDTLNIKDRIADKGVDMVIKNQVLDIFSQIDEPQKPKVPQVAVEFYEKYKDGMLALGEWFSDFYSNEAIEDFPRMEELTEWLYDNDNETNSRRELALATLVTLGIDAVEIEQEKLYTVEILNPNSSGYSKFYLARNNGGKVELFIWGCYTSIEFADDWKQEEDAQLTEAEIKKDFAWAWQWAKPLEDN